MSIKVEYTNEASKWIDVCDTKHNEAYVDSDGDLAIVFEHTGVSPSNSKTLWYPGLRMFFDETEMDVVKFFKVDIKITVDTSLPLNARGF